MFAASLFGSLPFSEADHCILRMMDDAYVAHEVKVQRDLLVLYLYLTLRHAINE